MMMLSWFKAASLVFACQWLEILAAYQETQCRNSGGVCRSVKECRGSTRPGLCPEQAAKNVRCCFEYGKLAFAGRENGCGCYANVTKQCTGAPTMGATRLASYLRLKFGGRTEVYNCRTMNNGSEYSLHADGRAVDIHLSGWRGKKVFDHAVSMACRTGIQEVIFNQTIWTATGIRDHVGSPHSHYVHIGLNMCGAEKWRQ